MRRQPQAGQGSGGSFESDSFGPAERPWTTRGEASTRVLGGSTAGLHGRIHRRGPRRSGKGTTGRPRRPVGGARRAPRRAPARKKRRGPAPRRRRPRGRPESQWEGAPHDRREGARRPAGLGQAQAPGQRAEHATAATDAHGRHEDGRPREAAARFRAVLPRPLRPQERRRGRRAGAAGGPNPLGRNVAPRAARRPGARTPCDKRLAALKLQVLASARSAGTEGPAYRPRRPAPDRQTD